MRGQGFNVKCPGGHAECTANVNYYAPLTEYAMGKDIGEQTLKQDAIVKYVTTDGDSKSSQGVDNALQVVHPMWKLERLADPTHVGQAQFRRCIKAEFSMNMFPGCTTREQKVAAQKIFSKDLNARYSLMLKELMKQYAGDLIYLRNQLPKVL